MTDTPLLPAPSTAPPALAPKSKQTKSTANKKKFVMGPAIQMAMANSSISLKLGLNEALKQRKKGTVSRAIQELEDKMASIKADTINAVREHRANMNQILPYLFLGDVSAANNVQLLQKHNITHVLTVMRQDNMPTVYQVKMDPKKFAHKTVDVNDTPRAKLLPHFPACCDFIRKARERRQGVLVHCFAGVSRSASTVVAFMMQKFPSLSVEDAIALLGTAAHKKAN